MFRKFPSLFICGAITVGAAFAPDATAQPPASKAIQVRGYLVALIGSDQVATAARKAQQVYLPGLFVSLKNLTTGTQNPPDVTDLSGRFHLTVNQPGKYNLCWQGAGFHSDCKEVSIGANTYLGNIAVQAERPADTTTLFGSVSFRDGSSPRFYEPYLNVNSFAQVGFRDAKGVGHRAYVNTFGEYVLPSFPNKAPVTLEANVEGAKLALPMDPRTGLTQSFHRVNLRFHNIPPTLAPLVPVNGSGKRMQVFKPGDTVVLTARAEDLDNDQVFFRWFVDEGSGQLSSTSGASVKWTLPGQSGMYRLMAVAYDKKGGYSKQDLAVKVSDSRGHFAGVPFGGVVDGTDKPKLAGVQVEVNGLITVTDQFGHFRFEVAEAGRYVVNLRKDGYAMSSKIYDRGVPDGHWTLTRASISSVDPKQPIHLVNRRIASDCPGPLASRVDWKQYQTFLQPQWQDGRGHNTAAPKGDTRQSPVVAGATALSIAPIIARGGECGPGIEVEIPANSLVDSAGNPPPGNVNVALATVDLASSEQMPGDNSVFVSNTETKVMESFGAGSVDITSGTRRYNLKPGATAKVTLPVDPMRLQAGAPPPPATIPLLHYDERMGAWTEDGVFTLVAAPRRAYVGTVKHFSYVNSDLVKVGQACVAVRSPSLPPSYTLEVTVPAKVAGQLPSVKSGVIANNAPFEHVILNLPVNTDIVLVPLVPGTKPDGSPGIVPAGVFAVNTGNAQIGPTLPPPPANLPVGPPYYTQDAGGHPTGPCSTVVTLVNQAVPTSPATADEFLQGLTFRATNLTELAPGGPADQNLITAINGATTAYYNQIDPRSLRRDLADFFTRNGFPSADETIASYANSGDLGFGRDMHCLKRPASDGLTDIACYVTNYGDATTPDQDDANNAAAHAGAIATVAMEFTRIENAPGDPAEFPPGASRAVKFYVYKVAVPSPVHPGQPNGIATSANLDGKGERPVPQLCVVCHGGSYLQTELTPGDATTKLPVFTSAANVDLGAHFLPFDLRYYTFPNTAITLDESHQGPAMRKLNTDYVKLAFNGAPPPTDPVVELIGKWYATLNPLDPQDKEAKIDGWTTVSATTPQPATGEFYRQGFGHVCRTCHITSPFGVFQFQNASQFVSNVGDVQTRVCHEHVMPHAQRTFDLFWTSVTPSIPGLLELFGQTTAGWDSANPDGQCGLSFTPGGGPISAYESQIQPIFDNNHCLNCHSTATASNSQLNLSAGASYGNLVNVTSTEAAALKRVLPNNHANSYLWQKLHGVVNGSQMPLGFPPLSASDLATIQAWIDAGANH